MNSSGGIFDVFTSHFTKIKNKRASDEFNKTKGEFAV